MRRRNSIAGSGLLTLILSGVLGVLTCAPPAAAAEDDESAAETAAARALAVEGMKLAKSGQCQQALEKLELAEKLHHSPVVIAQIGECYITIGKLVQGSETLRKMLRDPIPKGAPPSVEQAYDRAKTLVQKTKPSIAGLTVTVTGPDPATTSMLVDGDEIASTLLGVELPLDPGEHVIEIVAPGFIRSKSRARLETSEKQNLAVQLDRDPNYHSPEQTANASAPAADAPKPPVVAPPQPYQSSPLPPRSDATEKSSNILAFVSYGVGAVGLGVGIAFGSAAISAKNSLSKQCPGDVCPESEQSALDSAKTKGTLSTIGFAVGAAGITVGTVLLLTGGSSHSASASAGAGSEKSAAQYRPRASIGLGTVALTTNF